MLHKSASEWVGHFSFTPLSRGVSGYLLAENVSSVNYSQFCEVIHLWINLIIFFTSRFMGRTNDNIKKAYSLGFQQTSSQLKEWKVKYDKLIMGKPSYDLIVDDLSIYFKKSWIKDIDSYL